MAIYNNEKEQNVIDYGKKSYVLYATIKIEIESKLDWENAIDEFEANCFYDFQNTQNCKVIQTSWEQTNF